MTRTQPQYVEIRQNRAGQDRAYLAGTRTKVQDVVVLHERFGQSADEIATSHFPHLSLAQVHGALAYFFEEPQSIWDAIREDHEFATEMKRQQEATEGGRPNVHPHSVSS